MLFIVPDFDDEIKGASAGSAGGASSSGKGPSIKVELDIEDAPFLEEPKPEVVEKPAPKREEPSAAPTPQEAPKGGFFKDKKHVAFVIAVVILIIAGVILGKLIFFSDEKPTLSDDEPRRITLENPPDLEPELDFLEYKMEPFFIEMRTDDNEIRFLRFSFTIPLTIDPEQPSMERVAYNELQSKMPQIRDAIFYYMSNKPITYFNDSTAESTKLDIINIMNEHLSNKVHSINIEEHRISTK